MTLVLDALGNDYVLQATTAVPHVHGLRGIGGPAASGVVGQAGSGDANGVEGHGAGTFSGVAGFGGPHDGTGAFGLGGGGLGSGVRGIGAGGPITDANSAVGVYGQTGGEAGSDADGILGVQGILGGPPLASPPRGAAVRGISFAENGTAVHGQAESGQRAVAIHGLALQGIAGQFEGNVEIRGDLEVIGNFSVIGKNNAKAAVVPLPDGSHRQLYCLESPESCFEDFGFGQLVDGRAQIRLDPDFAAVIDSDLYHVFVTEYEDNKALFVTGRSSARFEVHAKNSTASGAFSYRVVAKRKDFTQSRLELVALPAGVGEQAGSAAST